jgi:hypothetical protein
VFTTTIEIKKKKNEMKSIPKRNEIQQIKRIKISIENRLLRLLIPIKNDADDCFFHSFLPFIPSFILSSRFREHSTLHYTRHYTAHTVILFFLRTVQL